MVPQHVYYEPRKPVALTTGRGGGCWGSRCQQSVCVYGGEGPEVRHSILIEYCLGGKLNIQGSQRAGQAPAGCEAQHVQRGSAVLLSTAQCAAQQSPAAKRLLPATDLLHRRYTFVCGDGRPSVRRSWTACSSRERSSASKSGRCSSLAGTSSTVCISLQCGGRRRAGFASQHTAGALLRLLRLRATRLGARGIGGAKRSAAWGGTAAALRALQPWDRKAVNWRTHRTRNMLSGLNSPQPMGCSAPSHTSTTSPATPGWAQTCT